MKTTVTDDASVASSSAIDEALESGFLPTDREYRKTGRFSDDSNSGSRSAAKDEEQEEIEGEEEEQEELKAGQKDIDATSGDKDGETAAASQAAPTQKEKEEAERRQQKTAEKGESRWAKLSRENKDLRDREAKRDRELAELRAKVDGSAKRDTTQASQPAAETKSKAEPRPKIDDVDPKTGQPKYASYSDYESARDEWLQNDSIRKFQETQSKTERERQAAHAKQVVAQKWNDEVGKARTKHADFDAVALNPALPLKEGTVPDVFILESPQGADVLYYLGQHPEELERINGLNPIAQARELVKIELKVSGTTSSASSAKPVTKAPPPPHQVSGKGTVAKDAVEQALEEQDADAYRREQNSRDARLRSVRANRKK